MLQASDALSAFALTAEVDKDISISNEQRPDPKILESHDEEIHKCTL